MSIYGVAVDHHDDLLYRNYRPSIVTITQGLDSATVGYTCLNAYPRGFDDSDRIGRKIVIKRIQVGITLSLDQPSSGTSDNGCPCALAIIYDKFSNGGLPTWADVFGISNDAMAIGNIFPERFVILWHKLYGLQPAVKNTGTYAESGGTTTVVDVIDLQLNLPTTYNNGNAGNYTDIQTGTLWLMSLAENSADIYTLVGRSTMWIDDS